MLLRDGISWMGHIRLSTLIAFLGMVLVAALLGQQAFNISTVMVPAPGGTYVEGLAGSPRYINPLFSQYNQTDEDLVRLIFTGLTTTDDQGQIIPDLATDWEISEDGLQYTFHLRRDVRWHDGTPFTADDVLFTVQAIQDADFQGVSSLADLWRQVDVKRVDDYTVSFRLGKPFAPFLGYTTSGLLPAHLLADVPARELLEHSFNTKPIGTGPFMVREATPDHIVLAANPYFYGDRPYLERLEFKFYPDYESIFNAYQQGEVMGISRVQPPDLPRVHREENLNLFSARLAGYTIIFLNLQRPVFEEEEVRQALLYALDRQKIIDQILDGQGLVAHSPIMPNSWAYNERVQRYSYDVEKAESLLEEEGWVDADGDGVREKEGIRLEFAILAADDSTQIRIIEEITRQWEQVGVKANPQVAGFSGLVSDFLRPRRFDAVLVNWRDTSNDPDLYPLWHSTQAVDEGQNYAGFDDREADEMLEQARQTTDRGARAGMYRRFQEIFAEEVPSLLLYYPVYNYAVDARVRGVQISPLVYPGDRFRNIAQWYINLKRVTVSEAAAVGEGS